VAASLLDLRSRSNLSGVNPVAHEDVEALLKFRDREHSNRFHVRSNLRQTGVILGPLALVLFLSFRVKTLSLGGAQAVFWGVRRAS
jgi:hypothetical protein